MNKEAIKKKKMKLIEMTDDFCDEFLNDDYKQLCEKLIQKMSRKRNIPFSTGKIENWAASIVYALGQINFLFDKSFTPYACSDDICNYFGTTKSTTSSKAKKIRDMFQISYWDSTFSTNEMSKNDPFKNLVQLTNGLIVPIGVLEELAKNSTKTDDKYNLEFEEKEEQKIRKIQNQKQLDNIY